MLVMAGKPVDATIDLLMEYLEEGDCIIDGGNEWYTPYQYIPKSGARNHAPLGTFQHPELPGCRSECTE